MKPKTPEVLVTGSPYWAKVAADLARLAGRGADVWDTNPSAVPAVLRWCRPLRWVWHLYRGRFRHAKAVHAVDGRYPRNVLRAVRFRGKRVVLHWIGTDAMELSGKVAAGKPMPAYLKKEIDAHLADSPEIRAELAELGIEATVVRLLPPGVEADVMPLPEAPAALSYWRDSRWEFYGGGEVAELARRFPKTLFFIAGAEGQGFPDPPGNMVFLGEVDDMEGFYRQGTALVRFVEHDSLSAMVLEALARGRYVVYSRDFPCTHQANGAEEAAGYLEEVLRATEPNRAGAQYVREHYSRRHEAERLNGVYRELLGA